jgi:hypothetical protein
MDKQQFLDKTPYLYHLTSKDNLYFVKAECKLYSTVALAGKSGIQNANDFLQTRRDGHATLSVNGIYISIRDQQPITRALDRCLTDNWTREQFIYFLNQRVFTWPNLKRLNIHFSRYESEKPVILKLSTEEVLKLNPNPLVTNLNSGATRCIPKYRGAPPRGKDTFQLIPDYLGTPSSVAEVTFMNECLLPKKMEIGFHPDGPWEKW